MNSLPALEDQGARGHVPLGWTPGTQITQRRLSGDFLRASSSTFLIHTSKTQDKHLNTCKGSKNTSKARAQVASSCSITTSAIGLDFPGGPAVKSQPAHAGDKGSIPGLGRFPQATEQLSPHAATTEARAP